MEHVVTVNRIYNEFNNVNTNSNLYTRHLTKVYRNDAWVEVRTLELKDGVLYKNGKVIGRIIKLSSLKNPIIIHYYSAKELTYTKTHLCLNDVDHYYFDQNYTYESWFNPNISSETVIQYIFKCLITRVITCNLILKHIIYSKGFNSLLYMYNNYKNATGALNDFYNSHADDLNTVYNKYFTEKFWYCVPGRHSLVYKNETISNRCKNYINHHLNKDDFDVFMLKMRYTILKAYNYNIDSYRKFRDIAKNDNDWNLLLNNLKVISETQNTTLFQNFCNPLASLASR